jgi:c(7)-type cytochrome triheme protein
LEKKNMNKKIVLFLAVGAFLLSGVLLYAAGIAPVPDDYDEDTYGPWAPVIWTKPVKSVIFDHKVHTMDAGLDCDSCHDDLFEMEAGAAEENDDFTMETLYAGGYCGACHDGATAFASDTRCTACHIGVLGHGRLLGTESGHGSAH